MTATLGPFTPTEEPCPVCARSRLADVDGVLPPCPVCGWTGVLVTTVDGPSTWRRDQRPKGR